MHKGFAFITVVAIAAISAFAFSSAAFKTNASQGSLNEATSVMTSSPVLSDEDRAFIIEAAGGGRGEVELGRLAAVKGRSAAVKSFGRRMVRDHSSAGAELSRLAKRKDVTLPTDLPAEIMTEKDKLSSLSGADFDREYMSMMVEDHDKDVQAFEAKAVNASDPDLKRFVVKILPTLKTHQRLAKKIKAAQ